MGMELEPDGMKTFDEVAVVGSWKAGDKDCEPTIIAKHLKTSNRTFTEN